MSNTAVWNYGSTCSGTSYHIIAGSICCNLPHLALSFPIEINFKYFPCSLTRNITSHSMKTWLFIAYSDERWLYYQFLLLYNKVWGNALFELGNECNIPRRSCNNSSVTQVLGQNFPHRNNYFKLTCLSSHQKWGVKPCDITLAGAHCCLLGL